MYCPNCGKDIPDGGKFCPDCGFDVSSGAPAPSGGGSGYTNTNTNTNTNVNAAMMMNKKSEGLTLILSLLITGLGHIYIGQTSKGVGLLVAIIICWILTAFLLFPGILVLILWIYGMYDSYKLAKEYNQYLLAHNGQPPW